MQNTTLLKKTAFLTFCLLCSLVLVQNIAQAEELTTTEYGAVAISTEETSLETETVEEAVQTEVTEIVLPETEPEVERLETPNLAQVNCVATESITETGALAESNEIQLEDSENIEIVLPETEVEIATEVIETGSNTTETEIEAEVNLPPLETPKPTPILVEEQEAVHLNTLSGVGIIDLGITSSNELFF